MILPQRKKKKEDSETMQSIEETKWLSSLR